MTAYGNFEAIQQVFKTNHGSVWSARTVGTEESPDCCIKLLELNQDMIDRHDTTLAQDLLVAAALQQAMGNKSEFWAPVYGLGSQGTNAFYVSRFYPRSLQSVIDNNTALTAAELKIILLAIVDALMDLETAYHRSHSNLKPTNVLLDDASRIREGGVVLCDPDPSTENLPSLTRTPDTKAVGEFLYAMVTHKPYSTARWPLPQSDKWKELGSTGRQWRALCESLLNTVARRGLPTLENLRDQIEAIQPTRRRTPVGAVVTLLALAALGAAGYAKRDQLPGWFRQARAQVTAMVSNKISVPPPVRPTSPTTSAIIVPAVAHPAPPVVVVPKPPVVPEPPVVVPEPVKPVAPPPPVVPVYVPPPPAPVRPVVPPPVQPALVRNDPEALKTIQGTESPEFHSDAAKAEFIHNRDQFANSHSASPSNSVLADWGKILSKIQGIDADYPPLDPASSTGWPAGLVAVVNARRDAMLIQAIDGAFLQEHTDATGFQATMKRVQTAANAVVTAHDALARGDIPASKKAITSCNDALREFAPGDADLAELFTPSKKEFGALDDVADSNDRTALFEIADNEGASLAVRLAAWLHAGSVGTDPWPADFATLSADQARCDKLCTLLQEAGSIDIAKQTADAETDRQSGFYSKLRDQASVLAALKVANDPQYAAVLAKAPVWFRYDAALYVLRNTLPTQVTVAQKKNYSDLAGQVNASGVKLVHDVLKTAEDKPPALAQCGPGSVKDWQLRPGWTREHCTFISISSGDTLEFIRVHVADDPDGIDCYLCTTETPLALMQHLLKGDSAALSTAEALNASPTPLKDGMRLWSFNDKSVSVDLDEDDYRKCFVVSPSDQLPLQMVTPQTAFYLARRVGCRLPTSREWASALVKAKNSNDANMKGFATMGWKLRDHEFSKLLSNPNRDPGYWPDDNIFLGNLDAAKVQRQGNAGIWTTAALVGMGGSTASDSPTSAVLWPLSTLQSSSGLGFRSVGDGENYAGVFHDLIGNVSEYVMDAPAVLAEKVAVTPPLKSDEIVHRINDWFSPEHLAGVSVIGGSALSPPELDPAKPYPLPKDQNQFADVGFRMAFTDPVSMPNALRGLIGQAAYLTAP